MREGDREEDRGRRHREEGKERRGNWGGTTYLATVQYKIAHSQTFGIA